MRGMGNLGELLQPDFHGRDLPLFSDGLGLDEAQQMIVRTLLEDYSENFDRALEPVTASMQELGPALFRSFMSPETRDRMRRAFESAQEEIAKRAEQEGQLSQEQMQALVEAQMTRTLSEIRDAREASGEDAEARRIMGQMITTFDSWRATRLGLRQTFIDNLRAQLAPAQSAAWPKFERKLDRVKGLPQGRLSGESTDLLRLVDQMDLEEVELTAAAEALEGYQVRLADALRSRSEYFAQSEPRLLRAMQEMDIKTGLDIVRRQVQFRIRVRDVNEEFRPIIAAALPEDVREQFVAAALRESFDRVYRRSRVDEVLEFIDGLELSPEVRAQVEALEAAFRQEEAIANDRLVALMKREEPQEQVRQAERFAGFMSGDFGGGRGGFRGFGPDPDDPVRVAFRERRDMGEKFIERLAAVLSPEQAEQLPQQERRTLGGGFENLPPEMRARILERVDSNGNGRIDPEEQEAAARMFRERFRGGPGQAE